MKVVRYLKCRDWVVFSDQSTHMTPSLLNIWEFLMKNWKFWDMWFFGIFHYDPKILEILLKMCFFGNPFSRPPYFYMIDPWIKGFVIICDIASSKSGKKFIILEKNRKKNTKKPKKTRFSTISVVATMTLMTIERNSKCVQTLHLASPHTLKHTIWVHKAEFSQIPTGNFAYFGFSGITVILKYIFEVVHFLSILRETLFSYHLSSSRPQDRGPVDSLLQGQDNTMLQIPCKTGENEVILE